MALQTIGILIDMAGTALIGFVTMRVHHTVLRDRKIDGPVMRAMRAEQRLALIGIILVCIGKGLTLLP